MANSTSIVRSASKIHYAWVIVAITFLVSVINAGLLSISGILVLPLQQHFGWEASDVSSAFGIRLALFGLLGPFSAAMMDRYGVRRMVAVALLIILAGLVGTYYMSSIPELFVFWGLFTGTGIGLIALVLGATVATRWFVARRGLVTGLLTASNATGQLVFLPLLATITQNYGWQVTIEATGAAVLVCLALVMIFMRSYPADVGQSAYGDTNNETPLPPEGEKASIWAMLAMPIVVLKEAAGVPVFWALFFTFFICGASTNGLIQTHFIPLCGDFGIVPVEAAGILAMMGIFDLFGTVGSGWLSDRFDSRWLLFWYYGLRGLSLIFLPFTNFNVYGVSIFAIFYGLDWIATVPPTLKITIDRFGGAKTPIVFGWIFAGHQIGAALAAYGAGLSRTALGSYLPAFFISGVLCFVAAVMVIAMRKHRDLAAVPA